MNRSDGSGPGSLWRRLALWPRLVIGVTAGFLVLFVGFSILGIRAVDASTDRILHERLAIAAELADDFDGVLRHRLENLAAFDPRPASPRVERRLLSEIFRSTGGAFTTLTLLDAQGRVIDSLGSGSAAPGTSLADTPYVARALAGRRSEISSPFRDALGRPVVALSMPVRAPGVAPRALIGTFALSGPEVVQRLRSALQLGLTGHAELVGPNGIELASTETQGSLRPGEHLAFYRKMLRADRPGIADVPVTPSEREPVNLRGEKHVMAFVRLSAAPWGVALGGTDSETYAPARQLRSTLMLAGGGALAVLWLLTVLGARLLVRPVRDLTEAAEEMASGNLDSAVTVSEGGEIGVLAESLETMRVQLRDSLETVRRWGEELELKVGERTSELNARNRQLAAVGAILAAANESRDLEAMLRRCLAIVLDHTRMDAASIRLLGNGSEDQSTVVVRGSWSDFPCHGCDDPACLASTQAEVPTALGSVERKRLHPGCTMSEGSTAVWPLRGPSGIVGVLTLGGRDDRRLGEEEGVVLSAICDQIAVAVENARLASDLRRLEAQQEVQQLRSELISAVSHELRTPLGFIKSYSTTLLREDTPIEPATRKHFLEIIDEETDKLEHMIDELLDASRLQAGRLPIDRVPVDLGELVAHVVGKAGPTLDESKHPVELSLPEERLPALADALRIEQVLDNLLENAARYSDPGSPVRVRAEAQADSALLTVINVGDGIPADDLEQIFEPFYRGANATGRGLHGAGLGLAICRGILEAHGGKIWAENGPDRTVTFLLTLPLDVPRSA